VSDEADIRERFERMRADRDRVARDNAYMRAKVLRLTEAVERHEAGVTPRCPTCNDELVVAVDRAALHEVEQGSEQTFPQYSYSEQVELRGAQARAHTPTPGERFPSYAQQLAALGLSLTPDTFDVSGALVAEARDRRREVIGYNAGDETVMHPAECLCDTCEKFRGLTHPDGPLRPDRTLENTAYAKFVEQRERRLRE